MPLPTPIDWLQPAGIRLLDQTLLPDREVYLELRTVEAVAEAIRALRVRGAPLIGIAAAMGVFIAAAEGAPERVRQAIALLGATRPTAINLHWALKRMERRAATVKAGGELAAALRDEAQRIWDEDRAMCERIGRHGSGLLPAGGTVITVCNAGALATGGMGTALAPVYTLLDEGRAPHVIVPETRPLLQGSRLTAWELSRAGV